MKSGDSRAFRIVFDYYYPQVRFFVLGIVKNSYIADEIAQGVFIKLWTRRDIVDPSGHFSAYLYRITRNALADYYRQMAKLESIDVPGIEREARQISENPVEGYDLSHIENLVRRIVEEMPPKRREVFIMSRLDGVGNEDIANRLGLSKRTVERHLNLALNTLRNNLGEFLTYIVLMII